MKSPSLVNSALVAEKDTVDQVMDPEPPYYLFKVVDKAESTVPPLDEVQSAITQTLKEEKSKEAARKAADEVLASARGGGGTTDALAEAAKAKGYAVDETGPFTRNQPVPKLAPAPIKDEVFALNPTAPLGAKPFLATDGAVVVALKERVPADEAAFNDELKQQLRDQAIARKRQDVLEAYRNTLRERADISVNPDVIARAS